MIYGVRVSEMSCQVKNSLAIIKVKLAALLGKFLIFPQLGMWLMRDW